VSEISGSGGYDRGDHHSDDTGSALDAWADYDPEAELERLGITRESERERALAWDREQASHDGDNQAPGLTGTGDDAGNEAYVQYQSREEELGIIPEEPQVNTRGLDGTSVDDNSRGEHPYPDTEGADDGEHASQDNTGTGTADQAAGTGDRWRRRLADLENANAELKAENTQLGMGMSELESENADLGKSIVELKTENADLRDGVSALETRLERLEQNRPDKPTSEIAERRPPSEERDHGLDEHEGRWRAPSDEALVFGAAVPPIDANIAASFLAAGAAGVAWMHKRREASHGDRSKG
jgi:hypothetical protein